MTPHTRKLTGIERFWNWLYRFRSVPSITVQLLVVVASNRLAFLLRFDGVVPNEHEIAFWHMLPWVVGIRAVVFAVFRLYQGLWRYTSLYDLQALLQGVFFSAVAIGAVVLSPLGPVIFPKSVLIIDALLLVLLLGGLRMTRRIVSELVRSGPGASPRVLVYGAGNSGQMIVREMRHDRSFAMVPVGFVDDDRAKVGRRIHGVRVLGTGEDLARILDTTDVDEILIAMPGLDSEALRRIVSTLERHKVAIKTLPRLRDIIGGRVQREQIRTLELKDLLERAPVGLDPRSVERLVHGRRVMVTGAGGSIGSELCRQIMALKPASLVLFERYENSLHTIRLELEDRWSAAAVRPVLGDVTDRVVVEGTMRQHRPEIVFHAAAHKHVPLMEENPCESVKNNVGGTRTVAQAADRFGVDRFILISTDKAANPLSVMGASKRIAELVVQAQAQGSGTSFSIVRFGNVLGSNGSVIPRFVDQIRRGGPVTVTHPEMRRFFMLIPEAVQLVLHAAAFADTGVYVLEMGEQVKIVDVARNLIRLSGLTPDEDIQIIFTGLRDGEKLAEELSGDGEDLVPSGVGKIMRVRRQTPHDPSLLATIATLEQLAAEGKVTETVTALHQAAGSRPEGAVPKPLPTAPEESAPPVAAIIDWPSVPAEGVVCPNCGSSSMHRSKARSLADRIKKGSTTQRPFRCDTCNWRGWMEPLSTPAALLSEVRAEAPDLSALDQDAGSQRVGAKPAFSPRDLSVT